MENNSNMCFSTPGRTGLYSSTDRVFTVDESKCQETEYSRYDSVILS